MVNSNVTVEYSNYAIGDTVIDKAEFELKSDTIASLKYDPVNNGIVLSMRDKISDDVEIEGLMTYEKAKTFMKLLSQITNQVKENMQNGGVDSVSENNE